MGKIKITTAIAASLLLLFTHACSQGQQSTDTPPAETAAASETPPTDTAATVNGKPIPMSELKTAVRNVIMQNGMDAGNVDGFMGQFGPRILDQLIDGELLYQASEKEGHLAAEEEIDTAFAEL